MPDHLLPLPPYADVNEHTVCSRRALRALLPASMDDAKLDQVLADVFGKVVCGARVGTEFDDDACVTQRPIASHLVRL